MHDKEAVEMMKRCIEDIKNLRAQRDSLAPAAEAYGVIRDIIRLLPRQSQGYGEDLVWTLERRIREIEQASKVKDKEDTCVPIK